MMKIYMILLLSGHILGDFYLQSNAMSEKKNSSWRCFFSHCIIYSLCIALSLAAFWRIELLGVMIALSLTHFAVDFIKRVCVKKYSSIQCDGVFTADARIFIIDQLIHGVIITIAAVYIKAHFGDVYINKNILKCFEAVSQDFIYIVSVLLLFLINAKPVNILIKKVLSSNSPEESPKNYITKSAMIGTLERWIIIIFILMSQYSAIGFVLTAKSIARFNKISDDKSFAEYYLMGTLLSTILSIVTAKLIF